MCGSKIIDLASVDCRFRPNPTAACKSGTIADSNSTWKTLEHGFKRRRWSRDERRSWRIWVDSGWYWAWGHWRIRLVSYYIFLLLTLLLYCLMHPHLCVLFFSALCEDIHLEEPSERDTEDSCVIIDGIPVVGAERLGKLKNVLTKLFKKYSDTFTEHFPVDADGNSKGLVHTMCWRYVTWKFLRTLNRSP